MLKDEIRHGECETLDFKHTISSAKKIAKTLSAFANTKGGKLLIGIKDNGCVVGANIEEERFMLEGAADLECKPPVEIVFSEEVVEGKMVLVAYVPESNCKPHYARDENQKWWAYLRVNDECILAGRIMLEVMKLETKEIPSRINYGPAEQVLLQYLINNDAITIKQFTKLANIPYWKAGKILVSLIRMGLIKAVLDNNRECFISNH
ncbi:MAG: RNA-binding domain-containing protein [Cytophagaceae bacterium]